MGTYVRAEIAGRRVENVVVLPRFALRNDDTVLVANEERKLEIRKVEVVREEPRQVYITSGVKDGELVVTTTLDAPIPGTLLVLNGEEPGGVVAAAGTESANKGGETP
jgi:hypothetical protein